jgi:hypothetical protein
LVCSGNTSASATPVSHQSYAMAGSGPSSDHEARNGHANVSDLPSCSSLTYRFCSRRNKARDLCTTADVQSRPPFSLGPWPQLLERKTFIRRKQSGGIYFAQRREDSRNGFECMHTPTSPIGSPHHVPVTTAFHRRFQINFLLIDGSMPHCRQLHLD